MRLAIHPPTIDRARAQRALVDVVTILLTALPFAIGLLAGWLWRIVVLVWLAVLWFVGATIAGWDIGTGRRR